MREGQRSSRIKHCSPRSRPHIRLETDAVKTVEIL